LSTVTALLSSFVLRLVPEALAQQRIAGRVEAVDTGQAVAVRSSEELIAFLYGSADGGGGQPPAAERTDRGSDTVP
jgi:hypothetical protein